MLVPVKYVFAFQESRNENGDVVLKPVDAAVAAKLLRYQDARPYLMDLAVQLGLSASAVHLSLKRLRGARLVHSAALNDAPNRSALSEFFIHGLKYCFPAERGELTRGIPTSYAAPPLNLSVGPGDEPPPVWPHPEGTVRGFGFEPLYKNAPTAALKDPGFYELLALLDAIRDGRSRERRLAEEHIRRLVEGRSVNP